MNNYHIKQQDNTDISLMYYRITLAKYDQRRAQHKDAILPLVRSEPTLPSLNHDDLQSSHPIAELTSRHHQVPMESRLSISYENQTFKDV
ncbi:unnamed protein product [Rotaria sp. Silwood2]|nr:unnamed protein product [Rotaria sp. Silwood2]